MNSLLQTQALEQANRAAAQARAEEAAKARAAEETLKLERQADALREKKVTKVGEEGTNRQSRRNARYKPDGSVEPEGKEPPGEAPPPSYKGIDLKV